MMKTCLARIANGRPTLAGTRLSSDVSEGTIYRYFTSKEDLLIGIMAHLAHAEPFDQEVLRLPEQDLRAALLELLRYRLQFAEKNYTMLKATLSEILVDPELSERYYRELLRPFMDLVEQVVQELIDRSQIRPVDAALVTRLVLGMFMGLLVLRALGDPLLRPASPSLAELPEVVVELLFKGL
jgi:AcrR family transcriptional regulator